MYRSTPKQIPDKTVLYIKILYATAFHQIVEIIVEINNNVHITP